MRRAVLSGFFLLAIFSGWLFFRGNAAPQNAAPSAPAASILIMLGEHAKSIEHWDGSIAVSDGELAGVEGRQFSKNDSITSPSAWKCTTREDAVAPYPDAHYTEMQPGSVPPVRHHPVGIYATIRSASDPRISIQTAQGSFDFALSAVAGEPRPFLDGRVTVARVPAVEKLSGPDFEDDEPSITALPGGRLAVAWVAYRDHADRVLLRTLDRGAGSDAEEVTPKPRPSSAPRWRKIRTATSGCSGANWMATAGRSGRGAGRVRHGKAPLRWLPRDPALSCAPQPRRMAACSLPGKAIAAGRATSS